MRDFKGYGMKAALRATLMGTMAMLLAACAVGPDFQQPEVATPTEFITVDAKQFTPASVETEFWTSFHDPLLNELIDKALLANHDIRIAQSTLARVSL